jgi:hypothetical protein
VETVEHARRPARLERGELVPHPESLATDCVAWFPVPDAVPGGYEAEGVPAQRLDGDRVRLTGIPLFPYHVGLGDEVQVREQDGVLYAVEVVVADPSLVVRMFFTEAREVLGQQQPGATAGTEETDAPWWRVMRALAPHGCWFEQHASDYAAMAVDPAEWEYVRPFLELQERAGHLRWELATPLRATEAP